ncbi:MAG: hypothetical protein IT423_06775 [Pirellulaceae bacterium]|nr:hypothetical protein [Pirellulaceae bacterium]
MTTQSTPPNDSTVSTSPVVAFHPTLLLVAVIIGSLAGVAVVMPLDPVITMPNELGSMPLVPSPEYMAKYNAAYSTMSIGNSAINFSLIGAAIGTACALIVAAGASAVSRLMMALFSLLGGATGGALAGMLIANASTTQGRLTVAGIALDPMLQAVLFQTVGWGGIGIGLGLALAHSKKLPLSSGLVGGLLGALAAAVVHAVIGSIAFPSSGLVDLLPPNTLERLLWATYCGAALGTGLLWMFRRAAAASRQPSPSPSEAV